MPKYLIVRRFDVSVTIDEMPAVGKKSRQTIEDHFADVIEWEHSHVLVDDDGRVETFCVYDAPDVEALGRHAEMLGLHDVVSIREITGDVTPADFPLS